MCVVQRLAEQHEMGWLLMSALLCRYISLNLTKMLPDQKHVCLLIKATVSDTQTHGKALCVLFLFNWSSNYKC